MNLSLTQAGNYTALFSLIIYIANNYGVTITEANLTTVFNAVIILGGIIASIIGRHRQGDVSVLGVKRTPEGERGL